MPRVRSGRDDLQALVDEQAALRRVATLVARGAAPTEVFTAVATELGELLGADSMGLLRFDGDGATVLATHGTVLPGLEAGAVIPVARSTLLGGVLATALPQRVDLTDGAVATVVRDTGLKTIAGAPVVLEGRLWGVTTGGWYEHEADMPAAGVETRLAQFTELLATAIANAEDRAELIASRARIVAAADETRRRIERDLHDGTQQRLVSLSLALRAALALVEPEQSELRAELDRAVEGVAAAVDELQEISRGLHPAILSRGGLAPALRALARRCGVPVELEVAVPARLPEPVEVAAYYVVSEALTNAVKHATPSCVHVSLACRDGTLALAVVDDGPGGADASRGSGLVGLRDRVEAQGGTLVVESPAGQGTALRALIPLAPRD
jgi:signal transduction histidine kinase